MAWSSEGSRARTSTREWLNLKRVAKRELQYCCGKCGAEPPVVTLELDHIVPHSEGGEDALENVQWLCTACHKRKTGREAGRGRRRRAALGTHPREAHPGIVRLSGRGG